MSDSTNYPDLLGLITGGNRCNIGAAQVAVAVRPHIVRAGRPFEVILLVQNCVDDEIDVTMALHLPAVDAKKQRERFIGTMQRLVVGVKGAEIGYVTLPVTTLPDTAVSDGYRIGVEVDVKLLGKSNRIRSSEGGGVVAPEYLSDDARAAIESLKPLTFATARRHNLIEVPVTVMSGTIGQITDFKPGWVSVCKLSEYQDSRLLLHHYGPLVQINTLPKLKRGLLYKPLLETTQTRFAEAGYPLKPPEATAIAKLMTLVLEYATPRFNAHGNVAARNFNVEALLLNDPLTLEAQPVLPYWLRALITTLERDERAATYPAQVIPRYLYDDLLRDAINLGYDLTVEATGENLGSEAERDAHREALIALLKQKAGLDFGHVYLPLVAGGVLINDQFTVGKENPADLLRELGLALEERSGELTETERPIFSMINGIIARTGQRYGFYLGK